MLAPLVAQEVEKETKKIEIRMQVHTYAVLRCRCRGGDVPSAAGGYAFCGVLGGGCDTQRW